MKDKEPSEQEIQQLHEESTKQYPSIGLLDNEYVLYDVQRHAFGMFLVILQIVVLVTIPIVLSVAGWLFFGVEEAILLLITLEMLGVVFSYIVYTNYKKDWMIITNERIIQNEQVNFFLKRNQSIVLARIEDVSCQRNGLIETLFPIGTIRLATIGDETTYGFSFVDDPEEQCNKIRAILSQYRDIDNKDL